MDHHYDIAIIGMGCAGSHVVQELIAQKTELSIVIIDDFKAQSLEKTWSYWEKGPGKWDHLIAQSWNKGLFKMPHETIELDLDSYLYKTLESRDFIAFAKAELKKASNFTLIEEQVHHVESDKEKGASKCVHVDYTTGTLTANLVLDSRIDPSFFKDSAVVTLQQHFKGWVIKTESKVFNPEVFTMMDYNLQDTGTTSFTYVLPYSTNEALVEFTYFSKDIVANEVYDEFLKTYIKENLQVKHYEITKTEQGIIPMSSYRFEQHNKARVYKIGTAGGWVKPSTGYSFKMSEKKAAQLVHNILHKKPLHHKMNSKRFRFYDDIMLDVLHSDNARGANVFHILYKKNSIKNIFSFLDEETVFKQELGIMFPMTSYAFIKSFFKKLF